MSLARAANRSISLALSTLFLLAATESVADAVSPDAKIISGFQCRETTTTGRWIMNPNNGVPTATNMASTTIEVMCPLNRDEAASTMGLDSLTVRYFSPAPVAPATYTGINCLPIFLTPSGTQFGLIKSKTGAFTDATTPGLLTWSDTVLLEFKPIQTGAATSGADGTYILKCSVPPGASILSVRYAEN